MPKLRFPTSLILSVVIIQALTLGLLLWHNHQQHSAHTDKLLQRYVKEHGVLLAGALAPHLAAGDSSALLDTLELLQDDANWRYAAVFNNRRELVASLGEPRPLVQSLVGFTEYYEVIDGLVAIEQPIVSAGKTLGLVQAGYAFGDITETNQTIASNNKVIAAAGLLLSTILLIGMNLAVRRGLRRLHDAVHAWRQGRWDHRIALDRANPIAPTAGDLNALAVHLQTSRAELRSQYEQLLQESRRLNSLLHSSNAVIWEADPQSGCFTFVSTEAERLLGYASEEWLQPDFLERHVHENDLEWIQGLLRHPGTVVDHHDYGMVFRMYSSDGEYLWLRIISSMEVREEGTVLVGVLLNVTEEKRSEQHIAYLANYDSLTGLINRNRFQQQLEESIDDWRRNLNHGALLFLDLDQFKYINDTSGHQTGDEYLRQVANHLHDILDRPDIIGRLGGDEFGIILQNTDTERATKISAHLLQSLNAREFDDHGHHIPFNASIGIALYPEHGDQAGELLAKADSAMYNAKEQGRNTYRTFEESTDVARMEEKIFWEARIHKALKEDRFRLYFQPIVDIETGVICHYETLLRMLGDDGEIIAPGAFIGVAERFGMIRDIDHWVVNNAIRIQGNSTRLGKAVSLTINLSGRQFGNPDILKVIEDATRESGADPGNIIFEVTETAAVENFNEAREFIKALHDKGYRLALDDFGAGFSSFDYLKHMPAVDYIKIDGSFVRNLHRDQVDRIFVRAIAEIARGLDIQTVAEFVENRLILDVLKELQVPLGQGYFFAKPAPRFHEHERVVVPLD